MLTRDIKGLLQGGLSPGLWSVGLSFILGFGLVSTAHAAVDIADWQYTIDSFDDGLYQDTVGEDSPYELYGMAMKEDGDRLYFAFNANLPLGGISDKRAYQRRISYGDLFLNFGDASFRESDRENIYGVRFDDLNDGRSQIALYQGVHAASLTRANRGTSTLAQNHANIQALGGTVRYGDWGDDLSYFNGATGAPTTMYGGTYLSGIVVITEGPVLQELDFVALGATGTHTFVIELDRSSLPVGAFIAHIFPESGADGMVFQGHLSKPAPVPTDSVPTDSVPTDSAPTVPVIPPIISEMGLEMGLEKRLEKRLEMRPTGLADKGAELLGLLKHSVSRLPLK